MPLKIAIADDHTMFLMGLKNLLDGLEDLSVVGLASNKVELMELLESMQIDILLLDIDFGRSDGIELCKTICKKHNLYILGLSMHKEGLIIDKMLKAGAKGYILKDYGAEEIEQAIQTVMAGGQFLSPKAHTALQEYKYSSTNIKKAIIISKRERDVLELIMEEMTTSEIADQLFISKHTVETHRGNLFSKFQVRNLAGLVKKTIELNILQK